MVVNLRGADSHFAEATGITSHIVGGAFDVGDDGEKDDVSDTTSESEQRFYARSTNDLPGIVLGVLLADRLGVTLGDTITIVSPAGIEQALTQFAQPLTMRFKFTEYSPQFPITTFIPHLPRCNPLRNYVTLTALQASKSG